MTVLEGGGGFPAGTSSVLAARTVDSQMKDWTITLPSGMAVTEQDVLNEDGKIMLMIIKGRDMQGNPYETVQVFERQ